MNIEDIKRKNLILIHYLNSLNFNSSFKFKAEYNTDDNDTNVVVVQEQSGNKVVFFGDCPPLNNYYSIQIFGKSIQVVKDLSVDIGNLIGQSVRFTINHTDDNHIKYEELWQIIFQQFTNPQAIEYADIRRIGYNSTLKCIVNLIRRTKKNNNE